MYEKKGGESLSVDEWVDASHTICTSGPIVQLSQAWDPPPARKAKLNVDCSRLSTAGNIGVGGVLRDNSGDWLGFSISLGKGQLVDAEIWGLYFSL